jgi:hypothetical protein
LYIYVKNRFIIIIIITIISRRIWRYVARMGEMRNAYKILVGKT